MKHSTRVTSFVMALTMPTVMVPQSSPPTTQTTAPVAQTQQPKNTHSRAKGAAPGAVVGAIAGEAGKGAAVGMHTRHNHREERRATR
jgi:hypothetical protein